MTIILGAAHSVNHNVLFVFLLIVHYANMSVQYSAFFFNRKNDNF